MEQKKLIIIAVFLIFGSLGGAKEFTVDSEEDWRDGTLTGLVVTDQGTLRKPIADVSNIQRLGALNLTRQQLRNTPLIVDEKLINLTSNQSELETNITDTNFGYFSWTEKNQNKIDYFNDRYRAQLEKVNCWRMIRVGETSCLGEDVLEFRSWSDKEAGYISSYLLDSENSERLDVAISTSKRIRDRINTIEQNNLSRVAIIASFLAVIVAALSKMTGFVQFLKKAAKTHLYIKSYYEKKF